MPIHALRAGASLAHVLALLHHHHAPLLDAARRPLQALHALGHVQPRVAPPRHHHGLRIRQRQAHGEHQVARRVALPGVDVHEARADVVGGEDHVPALDVNEQTSLLPEALLHHAAKGRRDAEAHVAGRPRRPAPGLRVDRIHGGGGRGPQEAVGRNVFDHCTNSPSEAARGHARPERTLTLEPLAAILPGALGGLLLDEQPGLVLPRPLGAKGSVAAKIVAERVSVGRLEPALGRGAWRRRGPAGAGAGLVEPLGQERLLQARLHVGQVGGGAFPLGQLIQNRNTG
mmetsp:Transcript_13478/g.32966  ORF Transcript_13478/g.32966 Transcript_13478/m.32966 type:complete len:287 (+) Transcript_13478:1544-2404(+)